MNLLFSFRSPLRIFFGILLLFPLTTSGLFAHNQAKVASKAIAVTANPLASEVGEKILRSGGNAIDAAVAIHFALAVVHPSAGNLGGGGFLLYRDPEGKVFSLDFREKAPLSATRDMYLDEAGEVIPGRSTQGPISAGVPGSVAGMQYALERWGTLSWREVIEPAYFLARGGFPVQDRLASDLQKYQDEFAKYPASAAVFLPEGQPLQEGMTLRQVDLARTLRRIQRDPREFYEGETAKMIVREMIKAGGRISLEDLQEYRPVERKPVSFSYRGAKIYSMAPPSSGGIAIAEILGTLQGFDLNATGPRSAQSVQWIVESERQAFADRSKWLGDPDYTKVPKRRLLSGSYHRSLQREIRRHKEFARSSAQIAPLLIVDRESEETTHFSVVDVYGGAVSLTTTLNAAYGSKVVVEGAGFLLNNEMDDFSIKPGHPNLYGLIGGIFNAVAPGKRPLSSMSPTIVERDGKLWCVVGTPGGSTIITTVAQVLINLLDFGMDLQSAVAAPRFHHQWLPDRIDLESDTLSPDTRQLLKAKRYEFHERGSIGEVHAIQVLEDGRLHGVADPRGLGEPRGF